MDSVISASRTVTTFYCIRFSSYQRNIFCRSHSYPTAAGLTDLECLLICGFFADCKSRQAGFFEDFYILLFQQVEWCNHKAHLVLSIFLGHQEGYPKGECFPGNCGCTSNNIFPFAYRKSSLNLMPTQPFPEFSFSYVTNSFDCPVVSSALRSSPVRFLHVFFAGPRPGINVLKHSLNQNILQMFVKVNCRPLFYVYFKPLTIQTG